MDVKQVAHRLVELCRQGDFERAMVELYDPNIISIEPKGAPVEVCKGMEAVQQKAMAFANDLEEMISISVSEPVVGSDFFAVSMTMKAKFKGAPAPTDMDELCVYQVRSGKIIREEFFFTPMQVS